MHPAATSFPGSEACASQRSPPGDSIRSSRTCDQRKGYATAKVCRTVLSGICGWLVRRGALPANPVRDVAPIEANRDHQPRALAPREIQDWLTILDSNENARRQDLPDLARFILATGLRLGEALGVRWSDIDLAQGFVTVERTVLRVKGGGLVASRLKSTASRRTLLLPAWARQMLLTRRDQDPAVDGPVFPDSKGGYRDRNNVGAAFRGIREGTDFDWVTPHTYRRTVATLLDASGVTARLIADQLGHSRISMTQDVYLGRRAVAPQVADALNALAPAQPDATAATARRMSFGYL